MCIMATVGRQHCGIIAIKVLPKLAYMYCLLGNSRSLVYPSDLSTNSPLQTTMSKKLFGKTIYETTYYSSLTSKKSAMIPLRAKAGFTITIRI